MAYFFILLDKNILFVYNIYMIIFAIACMLASIILFAVGYFLAKGKVWSFICQIGMIIALAGFGLSIASYTNSLVAYTICLIVSTIPQVFTCYYTETEIKQSQNTENLNATVNENLIESENLEEKPLKKIKFNRYLICSISTFASAFCIGFAGFYIGLENAYGYLLGLTLAGAIIFLLLALKKKFNVLDLISKILLLISAGIMIGQILLVLLFSLAWQNLLYCFGAFLFAIYSCLQAFYYKKYNTYIFIVAMIVLFISFLFY